MAANLIGNKMERDEAVPDNRNFSGKYGWYVIDVITHF